MKISLKIEGSIAPSTKPIDCEIDTPDNWNPDFVEITKVKGAIRRIIEELEKEFNPPSLKN